MKPISVTVFTHPTCTSCKNALVMVERLARKRDGVSVEVVSLAGKQGRERARREQVLSVPTILVGRTRRFVGVPRWDDLVAAVDAESASPEEG